MDRLFMLYVWDLSEKATSETEAAEIGHTVHIDESMLPAVFQTDNEIYLFAFTSEEEIPKEYIKDFAVSEASVQSILLEMCAVEKLLVRTPNLMINPFSDGCDTFTKEQLEKRVKEI